MKDYSYGIIPFYRGEDCQPRYFIGRSISADDKIGYWKFPKGHKEAGETNLEAALRETLEEIGVDIDETNVITNESFKESYSYTRGSENKRGAGTVEKTNTYWLAEVSKQAVITLNDEFTCYKVVTFKEALKLLSDNSQDFFTEAHIFLLQSKHA
ncbi:MAG: NUDIX domain-containing protein [Candidatus Paceibacterota bacterium]